MVSHAFLGYEGGRASSSRGPSFLIDRSRRVGMSYAARRDKAQNISDGRGQGGRCLAQRADVPCAKAALILLPGGPMYGRVGKHGCC